MCSRSGRCARSDSSATASICGTGRSTCGSTTQRTHLDGWALIALRIAVTIAVATLSYFLLEQPIRHGAIPARLLRPAVPALVGLLVVGLVFATASSSREERVVADPIRVATPQADVERVLVVGNSVALFLADEGFKTLPTNPRIDVLNRGRIGCTIVPIDRVRDAQGEILQVPATWCRKDWDEAEAAFRPDLVVLTFAEPTDSQAEMDGSWTAPCEPLYDSRLEAELHDAIHLFASGGAQVVLTTAAYANFPTKTADWFHHNDCQNTIIRRVVASEPAAKPRTSSRGTAARPRRSAATTWAVCSFGPTRSTTAGAARRSWPSGSCRSPASGPAPLPGHTSSSAATRV